MSDSKENCKVQHLLKTKSKDLLYLHVPTTLEMQSVIRALVTGVVVTSHAWVWSKKLPQDEQAQILYICIDYNVMFSSETSELVRILSDKCKNLKSLLVSCLPTMPLFHRNYPSWNRRAKPVNQSYSNEHYWRPYILFCSVSRERGWWLS